jgi:hypothetical protein
VRLHPQLSATAHFHGIVDYNKTAFAPPGCKIIKHMKPATRRAWASHGQHGYSLGPEIQHYRCQNVYISATASERIVDTLECFPHNYQMPQLSSIDILLMSANEMSNALQNTHPKVPFTYFGDETISALTALAEIFKLKIEKSYIPKIPAPPAKVTQRSCLDESSNPMLTSPMPPTRQTISQATVHAGDITNARSLPRVVTTMMSQPSPPRVPRRSQNIAPRTFSQDDFCFMDTAHMSIALGNHHWYKVYQSNAVAHPITGKEMEYMALMKDPVCNHFGNEVSARNAGAFFKEFSTFLELTHVYLSNLQTSRDTERSLMTKKCVIKTPSKQRKSESGNSQR